MLIEVIPFTLAAGRPARLPVLAGPAGLEHPNEAALAALAGAGLRPALLHSTSWRHDGGLLTLTYAAIVEAGAHLAWLAGHDPVVSAALSPAWLAALDEHALPAADRLAV